MTPVKGYNKQEVQEKERESTLKFLREIMDIKEGREPAGDRLKPLLDPIKIQTSSRLDSDQVEFVTASFWLAEQWEIFQPLKEYAIELLYTVLSKNGLSREEVINYVGAISSGKIGQNLVFGFGEQQQKTRMEKIKGKFKKEKENEQD